MNSCEVFLTKIIPKINEWQKAILELEELSDEFLSSSDEKVKEKIDNQKEEIEKQHQEYLYFAYPELPDGNGQVLFWPEQKMVEDFFGREVIEFKNTPNLIEMKYLEIENGHVTTIKMWNNLVTHITNFSSYYANRATTHFDLTRLQRLENFWANQCDLEKFPLFPLSIKLFNISNSCRIDIPEDLTHLRNLKTFVANNTNLRKLPYLPISIRAIYVNYNRDIILPEDFTSYINLAALHVRGIGLKKLPYLPPTITIMDIRENDFSKQELEAIEEEYNNVTLFT